jgi:hypothetical protein
MGIPESNEWNREMKQNRTMFFTVKEGPRALSYINKPLKWHCFKMP